MVKNAVVLLLMALCLSALIQPSPALPGQCPIGCYCSERVVDCSALMEFPMALPADTKVFKVSHLNVVSIPAYAFSYLVDMKKVEFINCNVAQVYAYAFKNLPKIEEIIFDKTVIGNIESFSFIGLENVTKIQFSNSRIGRIKPFAFYQLSNTGAFHIENVHIQNFYSHAFYNSSDFGLLTIQSSNISDFVTGAFTAVHGIQQFKIDDTAFWNMHCGVIDDMQGSADDFFFTQNTFYCNCSISWLLHPQGFSQYAYLRGISSCHGPDKLTNKSVTDVAFDELGCKGITTSSQLQCKRHRLVPRLPNALNPIVNDDNYDPDGPKGNANSRPVGLTVFVMILVLLAIV